MEYSRWLFFVFAVLCSVGCSSEYTYKDISINKNSGLEVFKLDSGKVRLLLPDGKPFTGVLHQTDEDTSQDSLIIGKYGLPRDGKWYLYEKNNLVEEGFYSNGEKDSTWTVYFPNGEIKETGKYLNGNKNGKWITYQSSKGSKYDTLFYIDGITKKEITQKRQLKREQEEAERKKY